MATITATLANTHGSSSRGRQPYYVQQIVDLTANSINPNGDVVEVSYSTCKSPKICAAGFQVETALTNGSPTDADFRLTCALQG